MKRSPADLLANARAIARSVTDGTPPPRSPERQLLEALERVANLPMHADVRFAHELAIAFLKDRTR